MRQQVQSFPLVNLIGATADDARDILILGESGIMNICPKAERPIYKANARRLDWPTGAKSLIFSAEEPDRLRGKQHQKLAMDELAAWRFPESFDQAMLGLRLGINPQCVIATTPRPTKIIKTLLSAPTTVVTRGTTYDNRANLARAFMDQIIAKYEGTRLGRQELNAEILDDNPGALWKRDNIESLRVTKAAELARVVVAIDPTATEAGDEAGIIVAGLGSDGHGYVLDDRSLHASPDGWARAAISGYHLHRADRIVAEVNNGGEMVGFTIKTVDAKVPYKAVHASRGKQTRAEPVAALYEQGKCHHVGTFAALEDELCMAGETSVTTKTGQKAIQDIRAGEEVLTRNGWCEVVRAGVTGYASELLRIQTEVNRCLLATYNHPVYNRVKGFVRADSLHPGDILETDVWYTNTDNLSYGTGGNGLSLRMGTTKTAMAANSIPRYGGSITELFQKAISFITKTRTTSILMRPTWNLLLTSNTPQYIIVTSGQKMSAKRALQRAGVNPSITPSFAPSAGQSSVAPECAPSSALAGVGADIISSIDRVGHNGPVYNLTVQNSPEFYAGGILVHNCQWEPGDSSPNRLDALVWALTELLLGPQHKKQHGSH